MQQISLQLPQILKYGIIGLGALLGILTYFLISKEQSSRLDRPRLVTTIYVFMAFSIILILIGTFTETQKKVWRQIPQLIRSVNQRQRIIFS